LLLDCQKLGDNLTELKDPEENWIWRIFIYYWKQSERVWTDILTTFCSAHGLRAHVLEEIPKNWHQMSLYISQTAPPLIRACLSANFQTVAAKEILRWEVVVAISKRNTYPLMNV